MLNYKNYGRLWRVYGKSLLRYGTPRKWLNALQTELAYRRRVVDVRAHPYLIFIEPLYYCNLACPLCDRQRFPSVRRNDAGRLPLELWDRILDELGDYLFQCHIFGLGEPLLDWPRTRAIIEKAHAKRIFTLVSTNCTLVTPQVAEEIVASGLDYVVCAIDGTSQATYERYRIGGSFEQALDGMRHIIRAKRAQRSDIEIEWQFLVHRHNAHEQARAREMAAEMGVYLRFGPLGGMGYDRDLQDEWLPDGAQWRDGGLEPGASRYPWHCYWLWRAVVINSNGQMGRCPGYQNVAQIGNVAEQPVMAVYNGPQSQRARQLFVPGAVPDGPFPTPCSTCMFYHRHHGGPSLGKGESIGLEPRAGRPGPADTPAAR